MPIKKNRFIFLNCYLIWFTNVKKEKKKKEYQVKTLWQMATCRFLKIINATFTGLVHQFKNLQFEYTYSPLLNTPSIGKYICAFYCNFSISYSLDYLCYPGKLTPSINTCYWTTTTVNTWEDSATVCNAAGAMLASFPDNQTYYIVINETGILGR